MIIVIAILIVSVIGGALYYFSLPEEGESIKIGVIAPLTGPTARGGEYMKRANLIAVDYVNEELGGVLGKPLEIIFVDSQSQVETAVEGAKNLILRDGVIAIEGNYHSHTTLGVIPVVEQYNIPYLTHAWHNDVTAEQYKYVFRTVPNFAYIAYLESEYLEWMVDKYGVSSIAFIYSATDQGRNWRTELGNLIEERDIPVEIVEDIAADEFAEDLTPELLKLKSANPDMVMQMQTGSAASLSIKQAGELDSDWIHSSVTTAALMGSEYWNVVGDYGNNVIQTGVQWWAELEINDLTTEFVNRYRAEWDDDPVWNSLQSFDNILVLADAINRAGSTDADKIIEALEETNLKCTRGTVNFHEIDAEHQQLWWHHQWNPPVFALQYQNRELEVIWPEEYATGTPIIG
jgi:branched-chain amino acid transport system substrate-binding protein